MRFFTSCLGLLLLACGGAPAPSPVSSTPLPDAVRVELRLRAATRLVSFRRTQSITLPDLEGHRFRLDAPSLVQLRQHPSERDREGFLRYQTYGPLELREDGERRPLRGFMRGLAGHQIRTRVDRHNRIGEGPELAGSPRAARELSASVLALSRLLELALPERAIAVGETWSEPPTEWRASPMELVFELERRWTLVAIDTEGDERTARISWDASVRLQPFEVSGVWVEGRGRLTGFTDLSLEDGVSLSSDLDLSFGAGPAGVSDVLSLFSIDAEIQDRVERAVIPSRGPMIQGVRPVDPRRAG